MRLPLLVVLLALKLGAAVEPWFGPLIPASGEDGRADCGMTAAHIFDAPIAGLKRIGTLSVPKSADVPETSNGSIGFECLDRGLFDPERCYDTLAAAGVKWARCQTMWSRCEKRKGVYDFSVLDGVVDNLIKRGVRPWFSVTFGNALYMTNCYTGAAVGCVPTLYGDECRAAWCAYVRALAKRYKGKVTHWEIWNEPDGIHFWQPGKPNAAEYIELVKLTGGIVREEIPDAKIGGVTSSPALNGWERKFFELGGAKTIDFWCGHAYTRVPERLRYRQQTASGKSADYVDCLKHMRAFIDMHGGRHVEIWQGESGFPSWFPAGHWLFPKGVCQEGWQSQANQAKWLLRRFVTDRRAGIVRSSFFQMADISRHYSMATTTQKHPAEHGIVNGWTYRTKMSCRAFGNYNALLATARHDPSVEMSLEPAADAGAPTVATAFRAADGTPLFLYYTAFDFSGSYTGTCYTARCDAKLTVPAAIAPKDPVLVDLLRGGVYSVPPRAEADGRATFAGLPLVDYPLVLADRSQVTLAAKRIFPFAMEGENLPNLWELAAKREPAGSGGFLRAKGSDFIDGKGSRRRFFGVNLYGPAALPDKADAPAMAERLVRWGINAVRIFPQYVWQLRADGDFSKGIDPGLLDRFDWLFFQLKQRGISADMNLHSARTAGYRFKDFKQTIKENKGLDNFDRTFIRHQKEFIRDVLTHVNPYTGLAYNDDPAVMTWEINNECSIVGLWFREKLEEKMTPYFRDELYRQFNGWLKAKYGTEERPESRRRDMAEFILDTEDRYWKEMYDFVKHEMGARAPVNCGTADYGAHYPQAYGDFIDDHFYYGGLVHFPGKPWDLSNWSCRNKSIVRTFDVFWCPVQRVFENRVVGKPFTISEANMMGQTTTAAEFFPFALAVGAFQNLAAFHAYTWSHTADHEYGGGKFLDMRGNAKYLAHLPAAVNMFVRGDVRSGEGQSARIVYDLGRQEERDEIVKLNYARNTHVYRTDPAAFLKAVTGRRLVDMKLPCAEKEGFAAARYGTPTNAPRFTVSSTGELFWDARTPGREKFAVDTPRTKFLSMFGGTGASHMFADGSTVTLGDTLMGWAAMSFTELSPGRFLLAVTGYQQASGAKLSVYGEKAALRPEDGVKALGKSITTMEAMGDIPYECEGVRATIRVPSKDKLLITPLDGDARPVIAAFAVQSADGVAEFDVSEQYQTIWYLVEQPPSGQREREIGGGQPGTP